MKIKKTETLEFDDLSDLPEEVQDHFKKEVMDGLDFMLFEDGKIWIEDEYTDSGREPDKEINLLRLIKEYIALYPPKGASKPQKDEANENHDKLIKVLESGIALLKKAKF